MCILFLVLCLLVPPALCDTTVSTCSTLSTSGTYILGSSITATTNPCIIIQGSDIELFGNGFTITDPTDGTYVGIQISGARHYLHDIKITNFRLGVDIISSSSTRVFNTEVNGITNANVMGIKCSGCSDFQIEGGSCTINTTSGSAIGLQFYQGDGIRINGFQVASQSTNVTRGIQISNSNDVYLSYFSTFGYCNTTGIEILSSSNVRLFYGSVQVFGCSFDDANAIGVAIVSSSDIIISNVNSATTKGVREAVGVSAIASRYIGLLKSDIKTSLSSIQGVRGYTIVYAESTLGFVIVNSTLTGLNPVNQFSTGVYLELKSQVGIQGTSINYAAVGVFVSNMSDLSSHSLVSTTTIDYEFQNNTGICSSAQLNTDSPSICYPPSNDTCCDSSCVLQATPCSIPTITSVIGLPYNSSGALITILGNNFGSGFFDTTVMFNDTLCLIHEKSNAIIICWLSGENSTKVSLIKGSTTYDIQVPIQTSCASNAECSAGICFEGRCIVEINSTILAGQAISVVLDLGNSNTVTISGPSNTFAAGSTIQTFSRSVSDFNGFVTGQVRILDFEFRVFDTNGAAVSAFGSPLSFVFNGPDVRSSEGLYVKFGQTFTSVGAPTASAARQLTFTVSNGGDGLFTLTAPGPTISGVTSSSTAGGRITISGANFGTSGEYVIVHVIGSTLSLFCPAHVADAQVLEDSIACDMPAGVGRSLALSVGFHFPASTVFVSSAFSYQAPTISVIYPNRSISTSELPGLVITVVGTNFGASDRFGRPLAPTFAPSLGGLACTNVLFLVPHSQFTCQLGSYASASLFNVAVGDTDAAYTQVATYQLSFAQAVVIALGIAAPARVCAGVPFAVNVSAFSAPGQLAVGLVSIPISFSSSDGNGALPSAAQLSSNFETFSNFILNTIGSYSLAVDGNNLQAASATITVARPDACGVCGGNNSTCPIGCDGIVGSNVTKDACGVCGGNRSTCAAVAAKSDPHDNHNGAIIGGTIGGFVFLVLVAALIAFLVRRRHRANQQNSNFVVNNAGPANNVKFGITEFGSGYSAHGLPSPGAARPPAATTPANIAAP